MICQGVHGLRWSKQTDIQTNIQTMKRTYLPKCKIWLVIKCQYTMGYLAASSESRCCQWTTTSLGILRLQCIVRDNYFHCLEHIANSLQCTWQIYIPEPTEEMISLIRNVKGNIVFFPILTFWIVNVKHDVCEKWFGSPNTKHVNILSLLNKKCKSWNLAGIILWHSYRNWPRSLGVIARR